MKTISILSLSLILFTSCSSSIPSHANEGESLVQEMSGLVVNDFQGRHAASTELSAEQTERVLHPVNDRRRGMLAYKIPLPANWVIHEGAANDQPFITGTGEVKVFIYGYKSFMYSSDPMTQQAYQMSGQAMRMPIGVENVLHQDIMPLARQEGLTLVEFYHDTDIAAYEKSYSAMLFKVAPAQDRFDVLVTEWKDKDGAPSMLLLKYMESASQGMVIWNYSITAMSANGRAYDQAKADLLYGLANIQNNPEQIQAYNQEEAHKANVSWSAHNQRMRANEESFQRTQEAYRNSTDAVNRSMMSTWETQNASSDRMQNATVNGIHEEHTITDPSTGQQYQVEAGYERYWTNGQGEQIMSNDHFYEPGTDPSLNGQWTEVEIDD